MHHVIVWELPDETYLGVAFNVTYTVHLGGARGKERDCKYRLLAAVRENKLEDVLKMIGGENTTAALREIDAKRPVEAEGDVVMAALPDIEKTVLDLAYSCDLRPYFQN